MTEPTADAHTNMRAIMLTCPTGLSAPLLGRALIAAGADARATVTAARSALDGIAEIRQHSTGHITYHGAPVPTATASAQLNRSLGAVGARLVRRAGAGRSDETLPGSCVAALAAALCAHRTLASPRLIVCGPLPPLEQGGRTTGPTGSRHQRKAHAPAERSRPGVSAFHHSRVGTAAGTRVTACASALLHELAHWEPALPAGSYPIAQLSGDSDTPADLGALTVWRTAPRTTAQRPPATAGRLA